MFEKCFQKGMSQILMCRFGIRFELVFQTLNVFENLNVLLRS